MTSTLGNRKPLFGISQARVDQLARGARRIVREAIEAAGPISPDCDLGEFYHAWEHAVHIVFREALRLEQPFFTRSLPPVGSTGGAASGSAS